MNFRRHELNFVLLASLLLSGLSAVALSAAPTDPPLARLHWLGLNQISADTNSAQFMRVWQLPPTTALVNQTLDKLSRWPGGGVTNPASALLRPLLDDLLTSEFYLEVYGSTNLPLATRHSSLVLAVRLAPDHARLWQTNLPAALPGFHVEFSKTRDWTIIALGSFPSAISHLPSSNSGPWLELDLPPQFWSLATGHSPLAILDPLSSLTNLAVQVSCASGELLTHATCDFSHPLPLTLPPWEIPVNFIHAPLTSFTAVRGFASWLAMVPVWKDLQLDPVPDQAFVWSQVQAGGPFVTYFAAPLPGASNQLTQLAGRLVPKVNPWLATNGQGSFQWQTNAATLVWSDMLIIDPFLKTSNVGHRDYLLGGLIPYPEGNPIPPPAEILNACLRTTNLVYFQSELTGTRLDDDFFILQLFRLAFHKPQLPAHAAATGWLKSIEGLVGASTTTLTQTSPQQLTLKRRSTVGLTALELHLLADWLESPQFPAGLHTFLAPAEQ